MNNRSIVLDYLKELIRQQLPQSEIDLLPDNRLRIFTNHESVHVQLNREELDDFEVALLEHRNTPYFYGLESDLRFKMYIALGKAFEAPNLSIATELLNEKGNWKRSQNINLDFNDEFCKTLDRGLKLLSESLYIIIEDSNIDVPELRTDKEAIDNLIEYYRDHKTLNSRGVGIKNLQLLKAAAFAVILEIERETKMSSIARVKRAYNLALYTLVEKVRNEPFVSVQLPECAHEYVSTSANIPAMSEDTQRVSESRPELREQRSTKMTTSRKWDVFISHASEDKDSFVRPLADALRNNGLEVWFDEFSLTVGDSLRRSIDLGLANSTYGVVVISPVFLSKEWPQKELDGLVAREVDGVKRILPVWHEIDVESVRRYSPILADRLATHSRNGLDKVVHDLLLALRMS